jgi:Tfp pilus assembly protein PilX
MEEKKTLQTGKRDRTGERGAALVMVLMIAFLLLVASAALLLESSMNTANVTDSVAEQQAYYAAESGIQSALDVLRGNTEANEPIASLNEQQQPPNVSGEDWAWLNPLRLIETSASAAEPAPSPDPTVNKIDFRKAVTVATSNRSNDTSATARLSRWLNYNYTPPGQAVADRVTVGSGTYNPENGMAFSVSVTDPDNIGNAVAYNTTGRIVHPDGTLTSSYTITSGTNVATISYIPVTPSPRTLTINSGSVNTNLGHFQISYIGDANGVTLSTSLRFEIVVNMVSPYQATRVVRGLILPGGTIKSSSSGVTLLYDSQVFTLMGSWITIQGVTYVNSPSSVPPKIGYEMTPNAPNVSSGLTPVSVSITPPEPTRVVVRAVGYGPRGARKQLETVVQKNFFNGLSAPATLTLIGPKSKTGSPDFLFEPGNSQNVTYSGDDVVSNMLIPSIGTTNNATLDTVESTVLCGRHCKTDIAGFPANVTEEMPFWLQSAKNLDDTIESLKVVAQASGRYYTAGQTPPNFGDNLNAKGITFVDGDVSLSGAGGGILVCTGKLTLNGGFNFNGLIIVTGAQGVRRSGTGGGEITGNMVVAPYDKSNISGGFLPPQFDTRGGGNSQMRYNSSAVANGMLAVSNFVQGVAEK